MQTARSLHACSACALLQVGHKPDFAEPVVCSFDRGGTTVKAFAAQVSTQMLKEFAYAMVWGTSSKHMPQRCGKAHRLEDEGALSMRSLLRVCMRRLARAGTCASVPHNPTGVRAHSEAPAALLGGARLCCIADCRSCFDVIVERSDQNFASAVQMWCR